MILSNNAFQNFPSISSDTIKRINIAWIKNENELIDIIKNSNHQIFYDYPYKRTKYPQPKMDIFTAIDIANKYCKKIIYFAISNAEDPIFLNIIRSRIKDTIKMVPKIESVIGVDNLKNIMNACKTDVFMLDKEDLFSNVQNNNQQLNENLNKLNQIAKHEKYTILGLTGVIFDKINL